MSDIILLDMLGKDGKDKLKGIRQSREKTAARERLKIDNVYRAVTYFDQRMTLRRKILEENTRRSIDKMFVRSTVGRMSMIRLCGGRNESVV